MIGYIEVTGVPLEKIVHAAYNQSRPQGLGLLHFQPGGLTDEEVAAIIGMNRGRMFAVQMDYVKGRSIKMDVRKEDDRLFIKNRWYDHSDGELRELLRALDLSPDLIEASRAEQETDELARVDAALAFLRQHDGQYFMGRNISPDALGAMVYDGLYHALTRGKVKQEFTDAGEVWTVV